mgnify:CR=1 FL=1
MTVKDFKQIIKDMEVEDGVEIRIVDQKDSDTYFHNAVEGVEVSSDKECKYIILFSKEEL